MAKHDDEILSKLTEEERAALSEGDEEGEDAPAAGEAEAGKAVEAEAKAEDAAKPVEDGKSPETKAETKAEAKTDAKLGDESKAAKVVAAEAPVPTESKAEERERGAPVPRWDAPADAKAKLDVIEAKRDDLVQKFDDGDMTAKEHMAELRKLEGEERAIRDALLKADMAAEMRAAHWSDETVPAFLDTHKEYEVGEPLYDMLDAALRRRQVEAGKKGEEVFSRALLLAAHSEVAAQVAKIRGETPKGETPAPTGKTDAKPAAVAPKDKLEVKPREAPPPTLGRVPAEGIADTDDGAASRLDRLAADDPIAFQDALGKLSKADREAYYATAN